MQPSSALKRSFAVTFIFTWLVGETIWPMYGFHSSALRAAVRSLSEHAARCAPCLRHCSMTRGAREEEALA